MTDDTANPDRHRLRLVVSNDGPMVACDPPQPFSDVDEDRERRALAVLDRWREKGLKPTTPIYDSHVYKPPSRARLAVMPDEPERGDRAINWLRDEARYQESLAENALRQFQKAVAADPVTAIAWSDDALMAAPGVLTWGKIAEWCESEGDLAAVDAKIVETIEKKERAADKGWVSAEGMLGDYHRVSLCILKEVRHFIWLRTNEVVDDSLDVRDAMERLHSIVRNIYTRTTR
ncbi:hypothetical protein BB934_45445 (plasmid) [Microvirga ossetica]|uniref:Uncharacterized protein n=1 Tax=Microvirga ossetica TaxID=1882682 RepID=A0A1B2EZW1_9HYPH|nr:hypothetical protein [Microvirga ossetica]ANY85467.1 hypothetical protein BB934_45445 [Microvirga ossetica]